MKILKYVFFLLLIVFIAGSIYIATKNGDYQMERTSTINAPVSLIYDEVNDFENWGNWSLWNQEDVILDYSEETKGTGPTISWKSEEIGDGSITTKEAIPYSSITQQLNLETSIGQANSNIYWNFEEVENGTKVTWGIKGNLSFKEKLAFFIQDNNFSELFKPIFEQGLIDLENNIVRKMEEYTINVDGTTQHGGGYYMYLTTSAKINEVYTRAAKMIGQVRLYMEENNISIDGNPFIIYNQRNETNRTSIFSAAIPTPSLVVTPSGSPVLNGFLAPQKVVKTTLKGNYKNATEAWETTYRYIIENDLAVNPNGEPFEVFVAGPEEEENPANWVTEIYIPVVDNNLEE